MAGGELDAFMGFSKFKADSPSEEAKVQIIGETSDKFEVDWAIKHNINNSIQIKSYEFGFQSRESTEEQKGDEDVIPHYPEFEPVKVGKVFDLASPKLLEAVFHAVRYDTVELWQRRAGSQRNMAGGYYFWVILGDVTVNSVNWTTSENSPAPEETVMLGYRSIEVHYSRQLPTGELKEDASQCDKVELSSAKHKKDGLGQLTQTDFDNKVLDLLKKYNVPMKPRVGLK